MLLSTLTACGPKSPAFQGSDITGVNFAQDFKLTDPAGKTRTLADFRGKVVVIFFGYTQCPDVCPTTLADLAAAMKILGKDSARVQVLFVTVDPERDTPALLSQYVPRVRSIVSGFVWRRRRHGCGRQGIQGAVPEAARRDTGQLQHGPFGRDVSLRRTGTTARVIRELWAGRRWPTFTRTISASFWPPRRSRCRPVAT